MGHRWLNAHRLRVHGGLSLLRHCGQALLIAPTKSSGRILLSTYHLRKCYLDYKADIPCLLVNAISKASLLVIGLHDRIRLNHLSKPLDPTRVRPRFERTLFLDDTREATRPAFPRVRFDDVPNSVLVYQLRMQPCVIKDSGKVDDRRQRGNVASLPKVLMSDDRFADGFGL